jgi:hypothetical protein
MIQHEEGAEQPASLPEASVFTVACGAYWHFAIGCNLALVEPRLSILSPGVCYILLSGKEPGHSVLQIIDLHGYPEERDDSSR